MKRKPEFEPFINYDAIELLEQAGYKLIAYTHMMCEDTYFFGSHEIAHKAYVEFELTKPCRVDGWWYGMEEMREVMQFSIDHFKTELEIFFL